MRRLHVVITILVFAGIASMTAETARDSSVHAIAALNDSIQERFKDIDQAFGFRRMVRIGETPHRFQPESVREMKAVRDLEREGFQVVLYLAGRRTLRPKPAALDGGDHASVWPAIKGPVIVTKSNAAAPRAADLWDETRRAMVMFRNRESHEFEIADWKFTVRPVRASVAACLQCHTERSASSVPSAPPNNALRIGDPLGAVLYGVRSAR